MQPLHCQKLLTPSYGADHRIALYSPYPFMYRLFEKHFRDASPLCTVLPQLPLEEWTSTALDADVMFLDFSEQMQILEHIESLRIKYTNVSILVKARSNHPAFRKAILKSGANCYFSYKQDPRESVEQGLSEGKEAPKTRRLRTDIEFSARELELLRAISEGLKESQIAERMCLSVLTVKSYKQQLFTKTECSNVTGLMRFIYLNGFHQV